MNINKVMRPQGAWGHHPIWSPGSDADTRVSEQCAQSAQNDNPLWR